MLDIFTYTFWLMFMVSVGKYNNMITGGSDGIMTKLLSKSWVNYNSSTQRDVGCGRTYGFAV